MDFLNGQPKTITLVLIIYGLLSLIQWLVKRITTKSHREEDLYLKERELLNEIRNTLQMIELKSVEMNKRIIDRLSDIVDDIRSERDSRRKE